MERPVRFCDACKQYDNHPRHAHGNPLAGGWLRHMDCCASLGCPVCQETEAANAGARGAELIAHLDATRSA